MVLRVGLILRAHASITSSLKSRVVVATHTGCSRWALASSLACVGTGICCFTLTGATTGTLRRQLACCETVGPENQAGTSDGIFRQCDADARARECLADSDAIQEGGSCECCFRPALADEEAPGSCKADSIDLSDGTEATNPGRRLGEAGASGREAGCAACLLDTRGAEEHSDSHGCADQDTGRRASAEEHSSTSVDDEAGLPCASGSRLDRAAAAEGKPGMVARLFRLLGWHSLLLIAATLASAGKIAASLANAALFGGVMNALGDEAALRTALSRLVAVQLFSSSLGMLQDALLEAGLDELGERLRFALFGALLRQDAAFFDTHSTGQLSAQISSDVDKVCGFVRMLTTETLETTLGIVGHLGQLVRVSPEVCKRIVLAIAPGFTIFGVLLSLISRSSADVEAAKHRVGSSISEALVNIRTVQSFVAEDHELAKYMESCKGCKSLQVRLRFLNRALSATGTLWFNGVQALILATSSQLVRAGQITGGTVSTLFLHMFSLTGACGRLLRLLQTASSGRAAAHAVFELLDAEPSVRGGSCAQSLQPTASSGSAVEFENVRFRYPARPAEEVLKGISLSVAPGAVVALVGASGAGKSTLGWLLQRFYDCEPGGAVRVDGHDVRGLEPQWLRRRIAYVQQEPSIFSGTIRSNVRYGRADASDEEVVAAAEAALVLDFARGLPDGLDTNIGDLGVGLSGGQKQRVAIARALLKDPRILILDEATSALDSASEHLVQVALKRLMAGRTTLVIAHRLSTVRGADRIFVLDKGVVAEEGSHAELVRRGGLYAHFVSQQERQGSTSEALF